MNLKESIYLMFNQMRECVKSPNTGPKVSDDTTINQTIDTMENQVMRNIESIGKTNSRIG